MSHKLVLIDTSVWIFALKKLPIPTIKERVDHLLLENKAAIVPMVRLEILGGTRSQEEYERLKNRLDALRQIPIGDAEWEEAARLAFQLHRKGKTIPYTDILIGSSAILSDALLLHADRHFDLMVEDTNLAAESLISIIQNLE